MFKMSTGKNFVMLGNIEPFLQLSKLARLISYQFRKQRGSVNGKTTLLFVPLTV